MAGKRAPLNSNSSAKAGITDTIPMSSGLEYRGNRICVLEVSVADLNWGQRDKRRRRVAVTAPATPTAMPISPGLGTDSPAESVDIVFERKTVS